MTQPIVPEGANAWLIGTRKGAWSLRQDNEKQCVLNAPWFFGAQVHHVVQDPRRGGTMLAAVRTDRLSFDRRRPDLEGIGKASMFPQQRRLRQLSARCR